MLQRLFHLMIKDGLYPQTNPYQDLIRVKDNDGRVWEIKVREVI